MKFGSGAQRNGIHVQEWLLSPRVLFNRQRGSTETIIVTYGCSFRQIHKTINSLRQSPLRNDTMNDTAMSGTAMYVRCLSISDSHGCWRLRLLGARYFHISMWCRSPKGASRTSRTDSLQVSDGFSIDMYRVILILYYANITSTTKSNLMWVNVHRWMLHTIRWLDLDIKIS